MSIGFIESFILGISLYFISRILVEIYLNGSNQEIDGNEFFEQLELQNISTEQHECKNCGAPVGNSENVCQYCKT